jgi:hypothetical protein
MDSQQAFDTLEKYLALTEPPSRPTLADCDCEGLTSEQMMEMATYAYNACINLLGNIYGSAKSASKVSLAPRCSSGFKIRATIDNHEGPFKKFYSNLRLLLTSCVARILQVPQGPESMDRGRQEEQEIIETKAVLQALYQRSRGGERDARRAGLRTPVFAGLNQGGDESPASALILDLITNLNKLLDGVRRGRLFRTLSEDERRTLAGFTYKMGKCAVTAATYHGADEAASVESLFQFLKGYEPNAADEALEDVVGGYSAADYWSDAQARDILSGMRYTW